MNPLHTIRDYLNALDPRLWPLAIALAVGGLIYLWRKVHPSSFARLPKAVQALPPLLIGAALSAGAGVEDLVQLIIESVAGGLSGLLAIGGHHAGKRAKKALARGGSAAVLVLVFALPSLTGCSALRSTVTAIAAAAPLLERITAEVERADRVASEIFRTYPDFPQSARHAYVRGFDGFQAARIHAIEVIDAAESLEDGDVQAALALLRDAYAAYMAWFPAHRGMDGDGRLLLPDGSVLSGDPPPPPAAFQLEG